MACRADDIEKYNHDIGVLEEAATFAQNVYDAEKQVNSDLTDLQGYYSKTVEASEAFINEFHELDKDAMLNSMLMKARIDGAIQTARVLLKQAEEEECDCEIHNPKEH